MFMEFEQGFLAACAESLREAEEARPHVVSQPRNAAPPGERTRAFLAALGYSARSTSESTSGSAAASVESGAADAICSSDTRHNQLALLSLAGWFDRAFQLPMRHAPGAVFFGGQLSPVSFGLMTTGSPVVGVAGRGLTLRQAFESCAGEAAERLSVHEWPGDRSAREEPGGGPGGGAPLRIRSATADDRLLDDAALAWAWSRMGLPTDCDPRSIDWVDGSCLIDGQPQLLPASLCLRPAPGRFDAPQPAGTTGCAAGPSLPAATLSALEELIERDAVARWWRGDIPARPVAPELLQRLGIDEQARRVRRGSPRQHWFLDVTSDLNVPTFVALSADPNGRAVVAGYGTSLDPRHALLGALLELCQMELAQELALLKREQRGEEALNAVDRRWIDQYEQVTVDSFEQFTPCAPALGWRDDGALRSLPGTLSRLAVAGYDAYCVNLSRRPLGIKVARVVVPGLETSLPVWTNRPESTAARRAPAASFASIDNNFRM